MPQYQPRRLRATTEPMEHAPGEYLHGFHGGLVLRHHKQMSCSRRVERPPLPEELVLPLSQHIGRAAVACVEPGNQVKAYALIAQADGPLSAPLHAPTSGRVTAIELRPTPHGHDTAIVIEPDDEAHTLEPQPAAWETMPPGSIVKALRSAGLVGLGGAVFPTDRKLQGPWDELHTLILNGAECEPYISCDEMLMREHATAIVGGARVLARAARVARVVIAIEDQMGEVERQFLAALKATGDDRIHLVKVPSIYPEGGERQLIKMLTGDEVPSGGLPQQLGVVCLNVATAWAAWRALGEGVPLVERYVTVTGAVAQPRNWLALLGTPVSHLLQVSGDLRPGVSRLVMGGPLMGVALESDAVPVTKSFNCVLALEQRQLRPKQPEMPCINCGECVRVCPANLLPQELYWRIRAEDNAGSAELSLMDCIECGCCDLVCPSHIPLVDYFRLGKSRLRLEWDQRERAERARRRHQDRRQRRAREQAEAGQALAARDAALQDADEARRRIDEAVRRARERRQPGRRGGDSDD